MTTPAFNPTHRLESDLPFTGQVKQVMVMFACTNQEATHILWECGFKVGTDRATWITEHHALTFLTNFRNAKCAIRIHDFTD